MAGDWIKMRSDLGMDPAVIRMSLATSLDPFAVVGRLHALWAWADAHTTNGLVSGVTSEWIDAFVRCPGFAEAMCGAGWLTQRPGGVEFPRFDRHMGDGAKTRAQKAKRQRRWRDADATPKKPPRADRVDAGVDGGASTSPSTAAPPEKRREEKRRLSPTGGATAEPPPARKPNPLFDALAEVTGSDPSLNGGQIGKTAGALSRATPPYTPDDVREFGRRFLAICTWANGERDRPTIGEVEKYIGRLRAGSGPAEPVAVPPRKGFRTRTDELYDHLEL